LLVIVVVIVPPLLQNQLHLPVPSSARVNELLQRRRERDLREAFQSGDDEGGGEVYGGGCVERVGGEGVGVEVGGAGEGVGDGD